MGKKADAASAALSGVKEGLETAEKLHDLIDRFVAGLEISKKGLVIAIRNWTDVSFRIDFNVKRGIYLKSTGPVLHPYSEENHGETYELALSGKSAGGTNCIMTISGKDDGNDTNFYLRAAAAKDGLNYVRFHAWTLDELDKKKKHRSKDGFLRAGYTDFDFYISISEENPAICMVEIVPKGLLPPRA